MVNQSGGFDTQRLLTFDIPVPDNRYRDVQGQAATGRRPARPDRSHPRCGGRGAREHTAGRRLESDRGHHDRRRRGRRSRRASHVPDSAPYHPATSARCASRSLAAVRFRRLTRKTPSRWRSSVPRRQRVSGPAAIRWLAAALEGTPATWVTVVGVAADVTMYNWWDGIDYSAVYVPLRQAPSLAGISAAVRTHGFRLRSAAGSGWLLRQPIRCRPSTVSGRCNKRSSTAHSASISWRR